MARQHRFFSEVGMPTSRCLHCNVSYKDAEVLPCVDVPGAKDKRIADLETQLAIARDELDFLREDGADREQHWREYAALLGDGPSEGRPTWERCQELRALLGLPEAT